MTKVHLFLDTPGVYSPCPIFLYIVLARYFYIPFSTRDWRGSVTPVAFISHRFYAGSTWKPTIKFFNFKTRINAANPKRLHRQIRVLIYLGGSQQ